MNKLQLHSIGTVCNSSEQVARTFNILQMFPHYVDNKQNISCNPHLLIAADSCYEHNFQQGFLKCGSASALKFLGLKRVTLPKRRQHH